jgi:hypothetical protein
MIYTEYLAATAKKVAEYVIRLDRSTAFHITQH